MSSWCNGKKASKNEDRNTIEKYITRYFRQNMYEKCVHVQYCHTINIGRLTLSEER